MSDADDQSTARKVYAKLNGFKHEWGEVPADYGRDEYCQHCGVFFGDAVFHKLVTCPRNVEDLPTGWWAKRKSRRVLQRWADAAEDRRIEKLLKQQ